MFRLGIDLGGTKIEGIALDSDGKECFRKRVPTEQEQGYDRILDNIRLLYDALVKNIGNATHTLGIGTPGAISQNTGLLKNSNTVCLNNMPVKADLEKLIGRNIPIQNDANCFAMAEAMYGAGKEKNIVFGVIMGTGCGGGIVCNGSVITGLQSIAGEWGHMSIDPNGPKCYCSARGCVETYISGGGLMNRYEEKYGERKKLESIVKDYYSGEIRALEFMNVFFQKFGQAMANLIAILDPDVVVLGGGVSNFDELYTKGVKEVEKHVFSDSLETPIVKHQLGDSAGVIGAALIGA
ncbi:MAG: ROK family protein [Lentisphaerae bacterium]|nr:ROK family protein [Lentisphaerota bacterium]